MFKVQKLIKHCLTISQRLEYSLENMGVMSTNLDKWSVTNVKIEAGTRGHATISAQILSKQLS